MKNVTVTWDLPTTRESGLPLNADDIQFVEVLLSADLGANFVVVDQILPSTTQEVFLPDQDVGDWIIRLIVVDSADRRSNTVDVPYNIADVTPPGIVLNVGITLS